MLLLLPSILRGEEVLDNEDIVERIITNDNDIYEGYISAQKIGEEVTFQALITTSRDSIPADFEVTSKFIPQNELSYNWKRLIEASRIEPYVEDGKKGLLLYSFKTNEALVNNVVVLEKDDKSIRYIDISEKRVIIKQNDINRIEYIDEVYDNLRLIDVIQLREGGKEIKGFITKQIIGETLFIKEENTNFSKNISLDDIVAIKKRTHEKNLSVFDLSKWIEVIETKNGIEFEGIIVNKNYGEKDEDAMMFVLKSDNSYDIVKMQDIVSIKRKVNPSYVKYLYDTKKNVDFSVNGRDVSKANVIYKQDCLVITDLTEKMQTIRFSSNAQYSEIIVSRPNQVNLNDVFVLELKDSSENKITYKDLLDKSIQSEQKKIGGVVIDKFSLNQGLYLFYVKGEGGYIVRLQP